MLSKNINKQSQILFVKKKILFCYKIKYYCLGSNRPRRLELLLFLKTIRGLDFLYYLFDVCFQTACAKQNHFQLYSQHSYAVLKKNYKKGDPIHHNSDCHTLVKMLEVLYL